MADSVTPLDRRLASWEALGYKSEYEMLLALQKVIHGRLLAPSTQDTALKNLQSQLFDLNEKIDKVAKPSRTEASVTQMPPRSFNVRAK